MRLSTSQIYKSGASSLQDMQSSLFKLQNQMSTGRKILNPEDDPIAAAQALKVTQSMEVNNLYIENQSSANNQLSLIDNRLGGVSDLLISVKSRMVQGATGTMTTSDRQAIAAEVRERYDELMALANSDDGTGNHLFAGYRSATVPFSYTGSFGARTTNYAGDDGQRTLQVSSSRTMNVTEAGSDVFMRIKQGNGIFMTAAGAANTGSGIISSGSVVDGFDDATYTLTFTGATTFEISKTPLGGGAPTLLNAPNTAPASTTWNFTSGQNILVNPPGFQFSISGTPAGPVAPATTGDTFTIAPSTDQDIFKTLDKAISALEGISGGTDAISAKFTNTMNGVMDSLDRALDNILRVRTDIGGRQVELDSLSSTSEDLKIQFKADLSRIQDLDYNEAITQFATQKTALEAAQLTFKQISQLSLFNVL